jgi:prevent-host-death family protein
MGIWTARDARRRLGALLDSVRREGPQRIRRRDGTVAVVLSDEQFNALSAYVPDLGQLRAHSPLDSEDLPDRVPSRVHRDDNLD